MADTVIASCSVSQNACQSMAMVVWCAQKETICSSLPAPEGETPSGQPARCRRYATGLIDGDVAAELLVLRQREAVLPEQIGRFFRLDIFQKIRRFSLVLGM